MRLIKQIEYQYYKKASDFFNCGYRLYRVHKNKVSYMRSDGTGGSVGWAPSCSSAEEINRIQGYTKISKEEAKELDPSFERFVI